MKKKKREQKTNESTLEEANAVLTLKESTFIFQPILLKVFNIPILTIPPTIHQALLTRFYITTSY